MKLAPIICPDLAAMPSIAHGFFTRAGGVSQGIYTGLNCGLGSADATSDVLENRRRIADHLVGAANWRPGLAASGGVLTANQVHSASAIVVEKAWPAGERPKADGLVTRVPGLVLGVLTADCAPVLFADGEAGVVGAAHAGWRGALTGVVEATIEAMIGLGAVRRRIVAAVGPCIGTEAYEVGPEFEQRFLAASAGNARWFSRTSPEARPKFDLGGYLLARLGGAGLAGVGDRRMCTYENESLLFSYRRSTHRNEPDYGRQIAAIVTLGDVKSPEFHAGVPVAPR